VAQLDPAKAIKIALADFFDAEHADWTATLEVDDDFHPVAGEPVLLVADDGGVAVTTGPWMAGRGLLRITIRLTAFARGRTEAREVVLAAIDFIQANRPAGISRIENVPAVLDTRDPETGAYLASIATAVVVKPPTA
jgi:hypothetical protein